MNWCGAPCQNFSFLVDFDADSQSESATPKMPSLPPKSLRQLHKHKRHTKSPQNKRKPLVIMMDALFIFFDSLIPLHTATLTR